MFLLTFIKTVRGPLSKVRASYLTNYFVQVFSIYFSEIWEIWEIRWSDIYGVPVYRYCIRFIFELLGCSHKSNNQASFDHYNFHLTSFFFDLYIFSYLLKQNMYKDEIRIGSDDDDLAQSTRPERRKTYHIIRYCGYTYNLML